jgi:hypothetical protein
LGDDVSRSYVDPYVLVATIGIGLVVAGIGYIGWWSGYEQGACEVGCAEATAGTGTGNYYGGLCRCTIDGVEVTLP